MDKKIKEIRCMCGATYDTEKNIFKCFKLSPCSVRRMLIDQIKYGLEAANREWNREFKLDESSTIVIRDLKQESEDAEDEHCDPMNYKMDKELRDILRDVNIGVRDALKVKDALDYTILELLKISGELFTAIQKDPNGMDIRNLHSDLYSAHMALVELEYGDSADDTLKCVMDYTGKAVNEAFSLKKRANEEEGTITWGHFTVEMLGVKLDPRENQAGWRIRCDSEGRTVACRVYGTPEKPRLCTEHVFDGKKWVNTGQI